MAAVTCALTVLALMLAWSVWRLFRPCPSFIDHPVVFFLLICGALLVLRLPQINWKGEYNPDESQSVAQGMRFVSHPVPWRDVDCTTCGPLNSLLLSGLMRVGAPANWQTSRTALWATTCLGLFFLYLTLRLFGTRAEAQFVLMPTVLFYALSSVGDFVHYSNEALSVLLLSAGLYLLAKEWAGHRLAKGNLFLLGLVAGSIPFAKLQAAPLALFLAVVGLAQIAVRQHKAGSPWTACWREYAALCLGGAAVPALILGVVTATGAFGDFWKSYILAGSYYVMEFPEARLYNLRTLFLSSTDATPYFIGALAALALLAWACAAKGISRRDRLFWPLVIALTDAALTAGCLIIAGKPYWHYLSLLIPPLGLVCGLVFFVGKAQLDPRKAPERKTPPKRSVAAAPSAAAPRRLSSFSLWLLAFSVCVAAIPLYRVPYYARMTRYYISGRVPKPPVAELVARVSQPGDCMAVWGWMPSFFVETGLTPATRDAIGHYQLSPGPNQGYFRNRYLRDMQQSRPVLFVDAVARGAFLGPLGKAQMHEGFPELARYVDENYTLWTGVKLVEGDSPVRLYVLKERLARLGPSIANPGSLPRAE